MNIIHQFFIILFLGMLTVCAPEATAEPERPNRHERMHERHGRMWFGNTDAMSQRMELTEAQVKSIETINGEYYEEMRSIHEQLSQQKSNLRRELLSETIDLKKVRQKLRIISEHEADIRYLQIKHRVDIEQLLTDKQKKELFKERSRMQKSMRRPRSE